MNPLSSTIETRWSSFVTGFFSVVPWACPTPGIEKAAVDAVLGDVHRRADHANYLVGGPEDLPRHATELAGEDLRHGASHGELDLLVGAVDVAEGKSTCRRITGDM